MFALEFNLTRDFMALICVRLTSVCLSVCLSGEFHPELVAYNFLGIWRVFPVHET